MNSLNTGITRRHIRSRSVLVPKPGALYLVGKFLKAFALDVVDPWVVGQLLDLALNEVQDPWKKWSPINSNRSIYWACVPLSYKAWHPFIWKISWIAFLRWICWVRGIREKTPKLESNPSWVWVLITRRALYRCATATALNGQQCGQNGFPCRRKLNSFVKTTSKSPNRMKHTCFCTQLPRVRFPSKNFRGRNCRFCWG